MTFFRSEEHLERWAQYDLKTEEGIIPIGDLAKLFSCNLFRRRMDKDYMSHFREYGPEFMDVLQKIGKTGPFWAIPRKKA
ncbi:MAG TPA: hypothetical protein ENH70_00565 [Desulfobacteraceae bacterium]|nr:hypothetical protein [Desulfobacteraceae bacterium]